MQSPTSRKQLLIDEANKRIIVVTGIAAFIVIFCAVAGHSLFGQLLYQNRIVSAKKDALTQLKTDEAAVKNLNTAYVAFVSTPQNILGGNSTGNGAQDGDNAKIVLDALPSKYDFPALATSLEKLLTDENVEIQSIVGTDDEVAQTGTGTSDKPQVVEIPFQVSAKGSYQSVQSLTKTFEASIRPIKINTLSLTGSDASLEININATTYYQPAKPFSIGTKVIK